MAGIRAGGARNRVLLRAAIAVASLAACADLAGVDDFSVSEQPLSCGRFALRSGECGACVEGSCCAEALSCSRDASCAASFACVNGCASDDPDCLAGCYGGDSKTAATKALWSCFVASCGASCVGCAETSAPFGADCARCELANGCNEANACLRDAECSAFVGCLSACDYWDLDPACRVSCADRFPDAKALYGPYTSASSACARECGWGSHWACADPFVPAMPFGSGTASAVVTIYVSTFPGAQPASGLDVRSCDDFDGTCGPFRSTDPSGNVTLTIPQSQPTLGFTAASRYFELQSSSGGRARAYVGRSFTGDRASLSLAWMEDLSGFFGAGANPTSPNGTIIVFLADCLGSIDSFGVEPGPSVALEGGPEPHYVALQPDHDPTKPGPWAAFAPVPAGSRRVHVFDTGGHEVVDPPPSVIVEPGVVTLLYVNFPVYL